MSATNFSKEKKKGQLKFIQTILKHKVLILIIVAILVVGSVVAFFVFGRKSSDNGYNNYLAMTQIRLYADKTSFYIGDEATSNFSVVIPSELSGEKLDIYNQSGEKVYSMDAKDMTLDKNGDLTCSIPMQINTETDGMQTFTAVAGQYFGSELSVFVTPHITLEQVMKSYEVGADVSAYLEKEYADEEDPEKVAKAAEKYLKKDERVGGVAVHGTDVYYSTVDMVAGMIKCAPQDPDMLGSGSSTEQKQKTAVSGYVPPVGSATVGNGVSARQTSFSEDSNIISAYNEPNGAIVKKNLIDSGNTGTNGNVLILRPETDDMDAINMYNIEDYGPELIQKVAAGNTIERRFDDDAVRSIFSRELVDYGTIILQTHGGLLYDEDGNVCNATYLMYRCGNETIQQNLDEIQAKLDEFAKMDYEIKTGHIPNNEKYNDFYSQFYGHANNTDEWRIVSEQSIPLIRSIKKFGVIKDKYYDKYVADVQMTSRYFMKTYSSFYFDNTIFYLGACESMGYIDFNVWLINHGVKAVIGYEKEVSIELSLSLFGSLSKDLTIANSSNKWRTNTLANISEEGIFKKKNIISNITAVLRPIPVLEDYNTLAGWGYSKLHGDSTQMIFLGNPEFFYSGTGSISGKVMYKPDDSDAEKAKETPCDGATVTAYLYHNKQFIEQKKVKTDSKGEFNLEGIRCGAYVLVITDSEGNSKKVSIVADNKDNDGGTVYLEKEDIQSVGNAIEYKGAVYYWSRPDYNKLIRLANDKEKVIFDAGKQNKKGKEQYAGRGQIAGAGNRIYFVIDNNNGNAKLCSVSLDGSDFKQYNSKKHDKPIGGIIGITPDKQFIETGIIDTSYYTYRLTRENYYFLNIKTGELSLIKGSADVLSADDDWFHSGEIFYIKYKESKRTITLYKSALDGSDKIKLGSFKTPRYDADAGYLTVSQALYPVIDDKPYVYFSYGVIQGTGLFFGSSRVARARLDGGDYKVIDTCNDNSTGALFFVNIDGGISYLDRTLTYDELGIDYYWGDDGIYVMDSATGRGVKAFTRDEIYQNTKEFSKYSLSAESAEIVGNKAFVLLQSTSEGETIHQIIIDGSVMLMKDLKSGKVTVVNKTKN